MAENPRFPEDPADPATPGGDDPQRLQPWWIAAGLAIVAAAVVAIVLAVSGGDDDVVVDASNDGTADPVAGDEPSDPADVIGQLQRDLTELGYYDGPVNGDYDEATESAVAAFQEFAGITVDGQYGPQTAEAIDVALGRSGGNTGLQTALAALCYYDGPIDGSNGPATTEAVRAFQVDAGVPADGLYGPATAAALVDAWPTRPDECPDAGGGDGGDTPEPGEGDGEETLNAITLIVDGAGTVFNEGVVCALGPDDAGSVAGTAADGTTISITLDGSASRVVVEGPSGSYDAGFTSVSSDAATLTIEAEPPEMTVLVARAFCGPEPLALESLRNATYQSEFTQSGEAPLQDGVYREPAAEDSATETIVRLGDPVGYGELSGELTAAVVIITDPGGSGTFYDLALVVESDGQPVNTATAFLGDRVEVNAVSIVDDRVLVGLVESGASEESLRIFELQGDDLVTA